MEMRGDGGEADKSGGDALTYAIIEAIIKVHGVLGPGFLESVYHRALAIELKKRGIRFATEVDIEIAYDYRRVVSSPHLRPSP
jgi:GxxExxY protein